MKRFQFSLVAAFAFSAALQAQTPVVVGYPANFDAYNNTGRPVYGFEIEADGISQGDVTRVFGSNFIQPGGPCLIRYCVGSIIPFQGGVYIRWESPYDAIAGQFTQSTPIPNGTVATGESCWTYGLGARYPAAGCEHFGISTIRNPTNIVYRWLVPDPANPGRLTYYTGNTTPTPGAPPPAPVPVPIPQPAIAVNPPAQLGGNAVVAFQIEAQAPPPAPAPVPQYGEAQWVKVFKLENPAEVDLNDLMGGNPVVPEDPAQAETGWKLLQYNPNSNGNSGILRNQAQLGNGSKAVVRRYEHYKYTGKYDPTTHQALCADGTCSAPAAGEVGAIIGAQNAAANLEVPSISVVKKGSGTVAGASGKINCGGTCFANIPAGTTVGLTAQPPSNGVFNGWTGACTGTQATCSVTVNAALSTTAQFTTVYTLSAARSGNGSILGTPYGEFSTFISCGGNCSAKFQQGTVVKLTATPAAGATFTGWSGACSGTNSTCSVAITADTKVQANFK